MRMIPAAHVLLVAMVALGCGSAGAGAGIHARMGYSEERGLRVVEVPAGGPAAAAGLREGDRIIEVDGNPVRALNVRELLDRLRGPAGSTVTLKIQRDGELRELQVERAPYR